MTFGEFLELLAEMIVENSKRILLLEYAFTLDHKIESKLWFLSNTLADLIGNIFTSYRDKYYIKDKLIIQTVFNHRGKFRSKIKYKEHDQVAKYYCKPSE